MIGELPDWYELSRMKDKGMGEGFTALEQFIYDQEPAGKDNADQFKKQLLNVINEN